MVKSDICNVNEFLNYLVNEFADKMISVGIPVQKDNIRSVSIEKIRGVEAGCYYTFINQKYIFDIVIHEHFSDCFEDETVRRNVINSLYHELLHTCPNCQDHNENWLKWSLVCDEHFGCKTRTSADRKIYFNENTKNVNTYTCPHCGYEHFTVHTLENALCPIL